MATMRTAGQLTRNVFEARKIGLWLAGVVCGALLAIGAGALHSSSPVAQPAIVVLSQGDAGVAGGRAGGIASADTASDWQLKRTIAGQEGTTGGRLGGLASADSPAIIGQQPVVLAGGRLGGLEQADTPTVLTAQAPEPASVVGGRLGGPASAEGPVDAAAKGGVSRIVGPGEGASHH